MPIIRKKGTDAVGGTTIFPFQGSQYEYLPFNALLEFAVVGQAGTPTNPSTFEATIYSGSDVLQERSGIDHKEQLTAIYPDDFTLQDVAAAGERIGVQLDGGTIADAYLVVVRITPL